MNQNLNEISAIRREDDWLNVFEDERDTIVGSRDEVLFDVLSEAASAGKLDECLAVLQAIEGAKQRLRTRMVTGAGAP